MDKWHRTGQEQHLMYSIYTLISGALSSSFFSSSVEDQQLEIRSEVHGDFVLGAQQRAEDGVSRHTDTSQIGPLEFPPEIQHLDVQIFNLGQGQKTRTSAKAISAFHGVPSCGHRKSISFPVAMTTVKYTSPRLYSTQSTVTMRSKRSSLALELHAEPGASLSRAPLQLCRRSPSSVSTQRFFFHSWRSPLLRFSSLPSLITLTGSDIATLSHGSQTGGQTLQVFGSEVWDKLEE
ncbi:hypothetical protein INR49_009149 [Caranx melampygus]|nr:hypothetical protein INR49_009149 [Caranx melampygus]